MKLPLQKTAAIVLVLLLLISIVPISFSMEQGSSSSHTLSGWEQKWDQEGPDAGSIPAASAEDWILVEAHHARPAAPQGVTAAWLRFPLPQRTENSALLIEKAYGDDIKAFLDNVQIYDSQGKTNYKGSKILIPLNKEYSGNQLYLWSSGGDKEFGIDGRVIVGSYTELLGLYMKQDLMDLLIGSALIFMATVLLVCSLFLQKELFSSGFMLVLVILASGVVVITYTPFLPLILNNYGRNVELLFDLGLFTLLPAFTCFFERIFGSGKKNIVTRFRKLQVGYSVFCLGLMLLNRCLSYRLEEFYKLMTINVVGILMIVQFILLLGLAVLYAYRGNLDAVIFTSGFSVFALLSLAELAMFYISGGRYSFYWWKWGIIVFVISLVVILGRRFARNHKQVLQYSLELEKFNNDLQRSEKMEIISELAASVAHEVRNPLQVTRGFLQIIEERSEKKDKEYLKMAVTELDRAASIITDFLTFAKPGIDAVEVIEVSDELKHVSGILVPLANLQGGRIVLKVQLGLQVMGSSPKFKQAFINILKNSVEALREDGLITVTSWKSGEHIIISVRDNGEGMKVSELARLGEPYYSNKTKGTGLGLMVTFRIIEAMDGVIKFKSKKGEGTEVIVKLPAAR